MTVVIQCNHFFLASYFRSCHTEQTKIRFRDSSCITQEGIIIVVIVIVTSLFLLFSAVMIRFPAHVGHSQIVSILGGSSHHSAAASSETPFFSLCTVIQIFRDQRITSYVEKKK